MKAQYEELNDPPALLKELVNSKNETEKKEFLNNTLPLNNTFAFGSISSEKAIPGPGERHDTCKLNGNFNDYYYIFL